MTGRPLWIGVVGLRAHARRGHVEHLDALPDAEIVAVCDPSPEARARHEGAARYATLDELLDDPNVDALIVASPNRFHTDALARGVEAGKHILVEKPVADRRDDHTGGTPAHPEPASAADPIRSHWPCRGRARSRSARTCPTRARARRTRTGECRTGPSSPVPRGSAPDRPHGALPGQRAAKATQPGAARPDSPMRPDPPTGLEAAHLAHDTGGGISVESYRHESNPAARETPSHGCNPRISPGPGLWRRTSPNS